MKPARILILTQEFPPDVGGCGVVAKSMANYLWKQGVGVNVLTSGNGDILDYSNGYRVEIAPRVPKIFPLIFMRRLLRYKLKEFTAILVNDVGAMMIAVFLPKRFQKKCLVYLQGGELNIFYKLPGKFKVLNFFGFKQKYIQLLKRSNQILAVSECMKQEFLSVSGLQELKDKITIVMPAINEELFYPETSDLRQKYQIPATSEVILSAGRIDLHKGYQEQYDVFKKLIEKDSNFHWLIVGTGPFEEDFKKMVQQDGLGIFITFAGRVEQSELRKYYSVADVFWQLSIWEALGLVYLEANACGRPAIGLKNSNVQEIINAENGFLVEKPEESLAIFLERKYKKFETSQLIDHVKKHNQKQGRLLELLNK